MRFMIIKDTRTNKLYLDYVGTRIRPFEEVITESNSKEELIKKYPDAKDLTIFEISLRNKNEDNSNK
jgi:hypothetical protein